MAHGREWIVDAFDCTPPRISGETGREALMSLFSNVIRASGLQPVGQAVWQFTGSTGAVTGMVALVESHLTCHSDPSSAYLALNLLSHRPEVHPDWEGLLTRFVGARTIVVRSIDRGQTDRGQTDRGPIDRGQADAPKATERRNGAEAGAPLAAPVGPAPNASAATTGAGPAEAPTTAPGPSQPAASPR